MTQHGYRITSTTTQRELGRVAEAKQVKATETATTTSCPWCSPQPTVAVARPCCLARAAVLPPLPLVRVFLLRLFGSRRFCAIKACSFSVMAIEFHLILPPFHYHLSQILDQIRLDRVGGRRRRFAKEMADRASIERFMQSHRTKHFFLFLFSFPNLIIYVCNLNLCFVVLILYLCKFK